MPSASKSSRAAGWSNAASHDSSCRSKLAPRGSSTRSDGSRERPVGVEPTRSRTRAPRSGVGAQGSLETSRIPSPRTAARDGACLRWKMALVTAAADRHDTPLADRCEPCSTGRKNWIKAGGGSGINMSSNVALMGIAGRDCYTAAKGGIAAPDPSPSPTRRTGCASTRLRHRRR